MKIPQFSGAEILAQATANPETGRVDAQTIKASWQQSVDRADAYTKNGQEAVPFAYVELKADSPYTTYWGVATDDEARQYKALAEFKRIQLQKLPEGRQWSPPGTCPTAPLVAPPPGSFAEAQTDVMALMMALGEVLERKLYLMAQATAKLKVN